jgi:GDP-L-fucose synthase
MELSSPCRLFVAGSSGMTGRAIVKKILDLQQDITCVAASFTQKNSHCDSRVVEVSGDLRDAAVCHDLTKGCEAAILAAATTGGILQNTSDPWRQVNDNLIMNARLLEALIQNGAKRIILIGSATSYQPVSGMVHESQMDWSIDPPAAYLGIGWVSRYLEKLCQFWHHKTGVEIIFIRAANIYGPFAKFDPKTSNFIPALIRKIEDKPKCLSVLGNPSIQRDVIFIDDFADACISLMAAKQIKFDVFNVGSSQAITVSEVVKNLLDISGLNGTTAVKYEEKDIATPQGRILDCQKIRDVVGWEPQWPIHRGLEETYQWWAQNKEIWKR